MKVFVSKLCKPCNAVKPKEEFYADKSKSDGMSHACKQCTKERTKKNYRVDIDRSRERSRNYAERTSERYKKNKRAYYERNREEAIARARKWVEDNPDQRRETWNAWYASNPTSRHAAHRQRRARLRGADTREVPHRDWQRLVNRYGGLCAYCRKQAAAHQDHIIPISKGGRHSIGNLIPACGPCNRSKRDRLLIVWRHRHALEQRDPLPSPLCGY